MNINLIFEKQTPCNTFIFFSRASPDKPPNDTTAQDKKGHLNVIPIDKNRKKNKHTAGVINPDTKPNAKETDTKENSEIADSIKINFPTENIKFWISIYVFQGLLVLSFTLTCIYCLYQKIKRNFERK